MPLLDYMREARDAAFVATRYGDARCLQHYRMPVSAMIAAI